MAQRRAPDGATAQALLDATERLLVSGGPAALSTRRIAEEAGQSHGLIRYHFGSYEQLLVATLRRATERILQRQRDLYARPEPFLDKWRTAMTLLESDLNADPFPKLAVEALAMAWNEPAYREALNEMMSEFSQMLTEAVRPALSEYDLDHVDLEAIVTLIRTFQLGVMVERLAGINIGHAALLKSIDDWLEQLAQRTTPPVT